MTDIYIRKRNSSKKPVIIALLILAAVALIIVWARNASKNKKPDPQENDPVVEDLLVTIKKPGEFKKPDPGKKSPEKKPKGNSGKTSNKKPEKVQPQKPVAPPPRALAAARTLIEEDRLLDARELCYRILDQANESVIRAETEKMLGEVNFKLVTGRYAMPEKEEYTIQRGDILGKIAKKFDTTIELVRKSNNVPGDTIRIGDRFRVLKGTFSATVDKSDNTLTLTLNDRFFKRYRVGTGKFQRTPIGDFEITDRIVQPTWWHPKTGKAIPFGHPDNVLGTHWLALNLQGYGIHGTWEPETIGKQESQGCIRLLNSDVEELFMLLTIGTKVTIAE